MTKYELSGRFGTFRAAGVAKARAAGAPISLDRAAQSAGGVAVANYLFGIPTMVAAVGWPLLLWPAGGWPLAALTETGWVMALLIAWLVWRHFGFAERSAVKGARVSALTCLGEAIADSSGAFNWAEAVLFMDNSGVTLTVYRTAGVAEIPIASPELIGACQRLRYAYEGPAGSFERLELHAMRDGKVTGTLIA